MDAFYDDFHFSVSVQVGGGSIIQDIVLRDVRASSGIHLSYRDSQILFVPHFGRFTGILFFAPYYGFYRVGG